MLRQVLCWLEDHWDSERAPLPALPLHPLLSTMAIRPEGLNRLGLQMHRTLGDEDVKRKWIRVQTRNTKPLWGKESGEFLLFFGDTERAGTCSTGTEPVQRPVPGVQWPGEATEDQRAETKLLRTVLLRIRFLTTRDRRVPELVNGFSHAVQGKTAHLLSGPKTNHCMQI